MTQSYAEAVRGSPLPSVDPWPALPPPATRSRATPAPVAPSRAAPSPAVPSRATPAPVAPSRAAPSPAVPSRAAPSRAAPFPASRAAPSPAKPHALPDNAEEIEREYDFWKADWNQIFREDDEHWARAYWDKENAEIERQFFGD